MTTNESRGIGAGSWDDAGAGIGTGGGDDDGCTTTRRDLTVLRSGKPANEYVFYVYAHDTVTGQWLPIIIGATVQANVSNPVGAISTPGPNASVTQPFSYTGWAIDLGSPSGTGLDYVNVYACQWHNCNGFVNSYGTTYGVSRPDVAAQYGAPFQPSGYQVNITGLPANEYQLRSYAHVVLTGGWHVLDVHTYVNLTTPALTIDRQGTGTGGISASGLSCPGGSTTQGVPCGAAYPLHTVVTLTPQPDPGSTFGNWIGACTGTGTCQVTMSNAKFVSATFNKVPTSIDTTYYHTDTVGSVRAITDATGAVVVRHDYMPFGEDAAPMTGDPMRFAGKQLDPETALHYFEARYYRNTWGRFSAVDPIHVGAAMTDPQQWNRYAYARNNPLAWGDPSGLSAQCFTFDDGQRFCSDDHTEVHESDLYHAFLVTGDSDFLCKKFPYLAQCPGNPSVFPTNPEAPDESDSGGGGEGGIVPSVNVGQGAPGNETTTPGGNANTGGTGGTGNSGNTPPGLDTEVATTNLIGVGQVLRTAGPWILFGLTRASEWLYSAVQRIEIASLHVRAGMLVGNNGAIASSREVAMAAGDRWVGIGARFIYEGRASESAARIIGKISADGQRVFRFTSLDKLQPYVNLESKLTGGNLHVRFPAP